MLLIHGDMKDKYVDVQLVYVDMQLKCTISSFQALVWDDALTGPFGLIAEYSLLKVM